jgi:two-component sensor histidine kinase
MALFDQTRRGAAYRYGFALGALAVAFAVRYLLRNWFPPGFPFVTFFPAIVVTAYVVGVRPAILAAVGGLLTAWYFFMPPYGAMELSASTAMALGFYVFVVAVDIFFISGMKAAVTRVQAEQARYAALNESKDLLARELHHRVSNNIQVVGSLLRLQSDTVSDPRARRALIEAGQRIELIASIQRQLNAGDGAALPFSTFARGFLADAAEAAGVPVSIEILGGEEPLPMEQATPVSLILLECFNNALEHGFGPQGGTAVVSMERLAQSYRLTIQDNGKGPPGDFDLNTAKTLGLRIAKGMAKQIQGEFSIVRQGELTVCALTFPRVT